MSLPYQFRPEQYSIVPCGRSNVPVGACNALNSSVSTYQHTYQQGNNSVYYGVSTTNAAFASLTVGNKNPTPYVYQFKSDQERLAYKMGKFTLNPTG